MSVPIAFVFDVFKKEIDKLVRSSVDNKDINPLLNKYRSVVSPLCETDLKTTVDHVFREILNETIVENGSSKKLEEIIQQSIEVAENDCCSGSLPLLLLSDLFDCLTLDKCEQLFRLVEDRVDVWKKDFFFKHCKNQLLRSCNDLLRRLSRSQNTVFCGRILVFLASFFPLSERSGLNIISEFNLDNITTYSNKDETEEKEEPMEEGETKEIENLIDVDYNLYRKFWSLQEFFRQPTLCYSKANWKHFAAYSSNILSSFGSFKLDDIKSSKSSSNILGSERNVYFAKYLTSQKLLELELSDSNFRRYVLIQFLILFHYLQSSVKFKQETFVLTDEQSNWIKETSITVYKLLKETPPDGASFAKNIELILKREEYWNLWKNEGCPDFKKLSSETSKVTTKTPRTKMRLGDELRLAAANKKVLLGNNEMNRLWNLCPDNLEASRSQKRDFVPSLEGYFQTAIEQSKSTESKDRLLNNSHFSWRALRLLSYKSPHFFNQGNQNIWPIPRYLENMVSKLSKELPQNQSNEVLASGGEDSEEDLLNNTEEPLSKTDTHNEEIRELGMDLVTKEYLNSFAEDIKIKWKQLATKLGFQEDEILYFASETRDVVDQGRRMLTVWKDQEGDEATYGALQTAMTKAGLVTGVVDV